MRGEVRLQGSPPGAATASSPNYISQQPERPERRERRALRGLLQSRRSPGDLPPPTTRWGLGSVASGEPCCGQDVGKGRSPTGPAEAGGPRRCREVRAVGRAQAGLRGRERGRPFSGLRPREGEGGAAERAASDPRHWANRSLGRPRGLLGNVVSRDVGRRAWELHGVGARG